MKRPSGDSVMCPGFRHSSDLRTFKEPSAAEIQASCDVPSFRQIAARMYLPSSDHAAGLRYSISELRKTVRGLAAGSAATVRKLYIRSFRSYQAYAICFWSGEKMGHSAKSAESFHEVFKFSRVMRPVP